MRVRNAIAILLLAAIVGCVANPNGPLRGQRGVPGPIEAAVSGPELGLITDEKLQVVDMKPFGAAAQAGVQIGDILVSIAPAPPLPPGQEPTPYPLPQDVRPIIVDEQGQPIGPTPVPGETMYIPGSPLVVPTPVIQLEPAMATAVVAATATAAAQYTAEAATPVVIDPDELATFEAIQATAIAQATVVYVPTDEYYLSPEAQATAVALAATSAAQMVYADYLECLNSVSDEVRTCTEPGSYVLTETVFFTEGQRVKPKIRSYPPNRMILTVLRDGQEIEIEVIPGPRGARNPEVDPEATNTPIPSSYEYY